MKSLEARLLLSRGPESTALGRGIARKTVFPQFLPQRARTGAAGCHAWRACKPDFVQDGLPRPCATIPLGRTLPHGSSCQPGPLGLKRPCGDISEEIMPRAGSLFGIAPGGACHAGPVASPPVGSYPTVSPLPPRRAAVCSLWRYPSGCPARALPGTDASASPDFPLRRSTRRSGRPALHARLP